MADYHNIEYDDVLDYFDQRIVFGLVLLGCLLIVTFVWRACRTPRRQNTEWMQRMLVKQHTAKLNMDPDWHPMPPMDRLAKYPDTPREWIQEDWQCYYVALFYSGLSGHEDVTPCLANDRWIEQEKQWMLAKLRMDPNYMPESPMNLVMANPTTPKRVIERQWKAYTQAKQELECENRIEESDMV